MELNKNDNENGRVNKEEKIDNFTSKDTISQRQKSNGSKILIFMGIIIGLLLISFGGYVVYNKFIVNKDIEEKKNVNDEENKDSTEKDNDGAHSNQPSGNNNTSEVKAVISELFDFTKSNLQQKGISINDDVTYKEIDNTPLGDWKDAGIATAFTPDGFDFRVVPEKSYTYYFSEIPNFGGYTWDEQLGQSVPANEIERQHLEELKQKISSMGFTNLNTSVSSYNKEQYGKGSIICHITTTFARCADKSWFNAADYSPFIEAAKERWENSFVNSEERFFGKISQSNSPISPYQRATLGDEYWFWRERSSYRWVMMDGTSSPDGMDGLPYCEFFSSSEDVINAFFGTPCYGPTGPTTVGN